MQFTTCALASLAVLALSSSVARSVEVAFFTSRDNCADQPAHDYQDVQCDHCVDPPLDWFATRFSGLSNNRVTIHNEDGCTSDSQVGQGNGDHCAIAGSTAIRSAFVAC